MPISIPAVAGAKVVKALVSTGFVAARTAGGHHVMQHPDGRAVPLAAQGLLSPLAIAAFRRDWLRLEAELRWHEEFETKLAPGTYGPRA